MPVTRAMKRRRRRERKKRKRLERLERRMRRRKRGRRRLEAWLDKPSVLDDVRLFGALMIISLACAAAVIAYILLPSLA